MFKHEGERERDRDRERERKKREKSTVLGLVVSGNFVMSGEAQQELP